MPNYGRKRRNCGKFGRIKKRLLGVKK